MIAIVDIDGTLVDSNYQHALAWYRALREHGHVVPIWRIHRAIGMGGDKVVAEVLDERTEDEQGDAIRAAEQRRYAELIDEVETFEGARELLVELKRRGHEVVLASSAREEDVEHYVDLLDVRSVADDWTHADDVEETKPAPDLVLSALHAGGGGDALMIGDTTWDVEAAARAGVATVALLTGGFSDAELRESGAIAVFASLPELRDALDAMPLR